MFTLDMTRYSLAMPSISMIILLAGVLHAVISILVNLGSQVPDLIVPVIIILTALTLASAPTTSAPPSMPGYMATPIIIGYPRAPFDRIVQTAKVITAYAIGFHYVLQWHPIITPHLTTSNALSLLWRYLFRPTLYALATVFSHIGGPRIANQVSLANQSIWTAAFSSQEWIGASQPPSGPSETLAMYCTFVMRLPSIISLALVVFMIYMSKTSWPFPPMTTLLSAIQQDLSDFNVTMQSLRSYTLAKALRLYLHFYPSRVKGSGAYGLDIIKPPPAIREAYQLHYPTPDFSHLVIDRRVGFGLDATPEESGKPTKRVSVKTLDWKACGLSGPVGKKLPRVLSAPVAPALKDQSKPTPGKKISVHSQARPISSVLVSKPKPFPLRRSCQPESERARSASLAKHQHAESELVHAPEVIKPAEPSPLIATMSFLPPKVIIEPAPEIENVPISTGDLSSPAATSPQRLSEANDAQIPREDLSALAAFATPPVQKPVAPRTPTQSTAPRKTWRPSSTGFSFAAPPMSTKLTPTTIAFASGTTSTGTAQSFVFGGKPKQEFAVQTDSPDTSAKARQSFVFGSKPKHSTVAPFTDGPQTPAVLCSQAKIVPDDRSPEDQKAIFSVAHSLPLDHPPAYRDLRTELEVRRAQDLASVSARQASLETYCLEPPPYQYAVDDCDLSDHVARLSIDDLMECEAPSTPKRKSFIRAWAIHKPRGNDHATRNSGTRFAPRHPAVKDVFALRTSQELHLDAKLQHNRRSIQDLRLVAAGTGIKPKVSTWVGRVWWHLTNPRAKRSSLVKALPDKQVETSGAIVPVSQPVPEINATSAPDRAATFSSEESNAAAPPAPNAAVASVFSFSAALPALPQAPAFTQKHETVVERLETDIDELYVEEAMEFGCAEAEKRRLVRIEQASAKVKSRVEIKAARERRANLRQRC